MQTSSKKPIASDEAVRRWPRLFVSVQRAALLTTTEASGALRDWYNTAERWGGEAVNHFGGTKAVLLAGIKRRHMGTANKE